VLPVICVGIQQLQLLNCLKLKNHRGICLPHQAGYFRIKIRVRVRVRVNVMIIFAKKNYHKNYHQAS
jgi:hypothetical protein